MTTFLTPPTAVQLAASLPGGYRGNSLATSGSSMTPVATSPTTVELRQEVYVPQNPTAYTTWTFRLTETGWQVASVPTGRSVSQGEALLRAALEQQAAQ